jgi:hypothetical protein
MKQLALNDKRAEVARNLNFQLGSQHLLNQISVELNCVLNNPVDRKTGVNTVLLQKLFHCNLCHQILFTIYIDILHLFLNSCLQLFISIINSVI